MNDYIELENFSAENYARTLAAGFNDSDWRENITKAKFLSKVIKKYPLAKILQSLWDQKKLIQCAVSTDHLRIPYQYLFLNKSFIKLRDLL